ncbi:MAG TPA: transglycosylase SLT domain-containing protein [Bryobacteraceae bacterium]|jgi:membrane-bound lytic murein transglycosylase D|nr:transglycosylase SLT domain-containing protein [Bryobacteraceae bacterium]
MMAPSQRVFAGLVLLTAASLGKSQVTKIHLPGASVAFAASAATDSTDAASRALPTADPELATDAATPHTPEADDRLSRADAHFNAGRQFYFQGNLGGARHEFDAAVDALLNAPDSLPDHRRIERRLDELCDLIYRFDIEKLGAGQSEEAVVFDKAPIDEISHMTFPVDPNLAPRLQTELNQTASGIPLELSDPVLGYVHYFSTDKGRKILLAGLRRSGRYKDLIQRIFTEEGVPQELIYLAQAESGFLPRAVSYKKAVGMWQFIPGTGATYNLVHTPTYDERFDPEKATRAAAKFLKDLYARYGDWYLAMAAYNCGAGAVDRAIERTGYADYWELLKRRALPKETSNYVPIIVAMTIMAKNPADYGLENVDVDPAVDYETIQLTADTNLNLIADATLQPVSVIRDLNPSLLRSLAPAGFQVHVPKGTADPAQAALQTVPAENRQAWRLHHVESGDTLATIAKSYHLTPERIVAVNRGADALEAGDTLLIPAVYHEEIQPLVRSRGNLRKHATTSAALKTGKSPAPHAAHIAASHRVPAQVLHRKAAIRTASLNR